MKAFQASFPENEEAKAKPEHEEQEDSLSEDERPQSPQQASQITKAQVNILEFIYPRC